MNGAEWGLWRALTWCCIAWREGGMYVWDFTPGAVRYTLA